MYIDDHDQFVCETCDRTVTRLFPDDLGLPVRQITVCEANTALVVERAA
jgi:hypothetical protein